MIRQLTETDDRQALDDEKEVFRNFHTIIKLCRAIQQCVSTKGNVKFYSKFSIKENSSFAFCSIA